jgi:hypothetical protein
MGFNSAFKGLIFFLNIYKEQPILIYSKSEYIAFSNKFDKLSNKLYIVQN